MNRWQYASIRSYALGDMGGADRDADHVNRVLEKALVIAQGHPEADLDVLIAACLLHEADGCERCRGTIDAGAAGLDSARSFLTGEGWPDAFADHVVDCIRALQALMNPGLYRSIAPSIETKILADADSLEAEGAIGLVRTAFEGGADGYPFVDMETHSTDDLHTSGAVLDTLWRRYDNESLYFFAG